MRIYSTNVSLQVFVVAWEAFLQKGLGLTPPRGPLIINFTKGNQHEKSWK